MTTTQLAMFDIEADASRRTRRFLGISAAAGALVTGIVSVMVLRSGDGATSTSAREVQGEAQQVMTPRALRERSAGSPLGPKDVAWTTLGHQALPVSSAGPHRTGGGRAWGFDHSPAGAVLAAFHVPFRVGANSGPEVFRPTLATQVVGVDRDKFAATIEADYANEAGALGLINDEPLRRVELRPQRNGRGVGYRLDSYDRSAAVVQVLLSVDPGPTPVQFLKEVQFLNFTYSLHWLDGDWRLVAPFNGSWQSILVGLAAQPGDYVMLQS